ncbi:F0F1 ATP synthase subunit B [Microlunatus elymi]|uniref:ATP synthase subunit b n=1 Tax=Microlunatus elymi TaxID=2596828 RepID=A0A516Q0Z8_9ACTN|nr:F0F1 ATP synthase subunit B [Microlunatus elymi]QDP97052.1 F0F1 ATP synthase subunit B [Microlunatus elymi]
MITLLVPLEENPILPHLSEIIAAIVFALILTVIVWKVVMPRFEQTYAQRAEAIEGGIQKAEKAQEEAQAALQSYQAQLADARGEAAQIKEQAKSEGAQIVAEMRERAQAEADRIVAAAHSQLEAERSQIVSQLRGELGGLATSLAGRIVGESLDDDERARRTVDRFIADLESSEAPEGANVQ